MAGRQGREVFAYLVLNRTRSVSRGELVALLWPERSPRAPEAALNTVLARLRGVIGRSVIAGRGQLVLRLPSETWIDVEAADAGATEAESLLAAGQHDEAIERIREALAVVAAPLLPEIEHAWVDQPRRELDDLCSRLLTLDVRAGLALGGAGLDEAERAANRLIEREPFRESGYALLMEVHAARGDVARALLVYERLRVLLKDELGIPPSPHVAALHRRLVRQESGVRAVVVEPPQARNGSAGPMPLPAVLARAERRHLVGRDRELAALRARWSQRAPEGSDVIALSGEAGLGKTVLAAALARAVHDGGGTVLYGHCDEEPILPYAPLVEALRHFVAHTPDLRQEPHLEVHLRELGWLIPELADRRATPAGPTRDVQLERVRLYQAVATLLARAARQRPLLLVLEDLQWADPDTLLMIRHLAREPTPYPLLTVLTYRQGEVEGDHPLLRLLTAIRREPRLLELALPGLDEPAVATLLAEHGQPTPALVRRLRDHTSGNPYFLEELVRALHDSGARLDDPALATRSLRLLPAGVHDVIRDRLRRLAPVTRDVLAAAAVLGQEFGLEVLEAVVGVQDAAGGDEVAGALDAAVHAGLIVEDRNARGRYRFRHALAREAVLRGLGRGVRSGLHLRAARALEGRRASAPAEAAQIAYHFLESGRPEVAEQTVRYLREAAARALASVAYEDAAQHYRRASVVLETLRPEDAKTHTKVLLELGEVSWHTSGTEARVVFEQALAAVRGLGQRSESAQAALGLGGHFYAPAAPDRAYIELLEEALEWAGDDEALRTHILGRLSEQLSLVDPARALRVSEAALATARSLDDLRLLARTMLSRHAALLHVEHRDERDRLAREEIELAARCRDPELEALGRHWLLYDLLEAGEVSDAAVEQDRLHGLAGELGPLFRHSALVWQRVLEQLRGNFERADQLAHEALNLVQGMPGERARVQFLAQQLAVVRDHGDPRRLLAPLEGLARAGSPLWSAARMLLELDCGVAGSASRRAAAGASAQLDEVPRDGFWLTTLAWLAEVEASGADPGRANALYDRLSPFGDRFVQLTYGAAFGSVHRVLGLLCAALGRLQDAAEHFEEAVRRHEALGAPVLEARSLADYGEAIVARRAGGSASQARPMLERAEQLAEACGATRLARRARAAVPIGVP